MDLKLSDDDLRDIKRVLEASNDLAYAVNRLLKCVNGDVCHPFKDFALDGFGNAMNHMDEATHHVQGLLSRMNHARKFGLKWQYQPEEAE